MTIGWLYLKTIDETIAFEGIERVAGFKQVRLRARCVENVKEGGIEVNQGTCQVMIMA